MYSKKRVRNLLIVTTDLQHPAYHRIDMFVPYIKESFNVVIFDIRKKMRFDSLILRDIFNLIKLYSNLMIGIIPPTGVIRFVIPIPIPGALILAFIFVPRLLKRIARQINPIIWAIGPFAGYCVILSKEKKLFIYDDNDRHYLLQKNRFIRSFVKSIEYACLLNADAVTVSGFNLERDCKSLRGQNSKVVLIPNSVDVDLFQFDEYTDRIFDLIYVGLLDEWSGLHLVLEAIGLMNIKKRPSLLIVGPVVNLEYKKKLCNIMSKFGLKENIFFTGRIAHNEVVRYLRKSSIGLATFPKIDLMKYVLPLKLVEYMSCGLAVIASNVGDTAEIVKLSECGVVVEAEPVHISKAISCLLRNRDLLQYYGTQGRSYVLKNFNLKLVAHRLISFISNLVK
ncbi:MAG: glycosyltransferase [Nitrososphaeria archaeon]